MDAVDCQPDFCLDLFEPSGHGRKRREVPSSKDDKPHADALTQKYNDTTQYTRFKENIEYTVLMPGGMYNLKS